MIRIIIQYRPPITDSETKKLIKENEVCRIALWVASGKKFSERYHKYPALLNEAEGIFAKLYPKYDKPAKVKPIVKICQEILNKWRGVL